MQSTLFDDYQREEFMRHLLAGEILDCPCCQRRAKVWRLRIHSTLASMLIGLYRKSFEINGRPDEWVHLEGFRPLKHSSGRDFCIVKYWGLAEPKEANDDEDKNYSGYWRLTDKGFLWVKRKTKISKYAHVFDNKCLSYEGDDIDIVESLGDKFSYEELIGDAR